MNRHKLFSGIDKDLENGMTPTGNIVRDAWMFGIIPETQTCADWTIQELNDLYDKVSNAWEPYGHLVSRLPEELRLRHGRIYTEAIRIARAHGWNPELDDED